MSTIKGWKSYPVTLPPGQVFIYNPKSENANIFQIINRVASGGGAVCVDIIPQVSGNYYQMSVQEGSAQNFVLPISGHTLYLYSTATAPLTIELIEIECDDISYTFGASQLVNISGNVQVAQPVNIDGTVSISGEVEVKNDTGNPLPVSGSVSVTTMPEVQVKGDAENPVPVSGTVNLGTVPEIQVKGDAANPLPVTEQVYGTTKLTASGETLVKTGSGRIAGIKSDGTVTATIKDGTTELWHTTGTDLFTVPIGYTTNLTINLSAAGTVYVIYI